MLNSKQLSANLTKNLKILNNVLKKPLFNEKEQVSQPIIEEEMTDVEDFRLITVSKGKPLQIDNPTSYKLIGQGAQGAVFQLSSKRCVKIYLKKEDVISEYNVLKKVNDAKSPYFPKVYETGSNYIVMEYVKGPTLSQYLEKKKHMPRWLTKELVRMLREMKKLKLTRLDASPRHIFVVNDERLQVIDHVNSFKKHIPYPRQILEELESRKLKKDFLKQVKRSNPSLYRKWMRLQISDAEENQKSKSN